MVLLIIEQPKKIRPSVHLFLLDHIAKHNLASTEVYIEQTYSLICIRVCGNYMKARTELACPLFRSVHFQKINKPRAPKEFPFLCVFEVSQYDLIIAQVLVLLSCEEKPLFHISCELYYPWYLYIEVACFSMKLMSLFKRETRTAHQTALLESLYSAVNK